MADHILLNNGDNLIKNDLGLVLLNAHADEIHIHGTHSSQQTAVRKRLSFVDYTFWLSASVAFDVFYKFKIIAQIMMRFELNLKGLLEPSIYTRNVRKSFVLELSELRERLKPFKEELKLRIFESDLEKPLFRFKLLLESIKRLKHIGK